MSTLSPTGGNPGKPRKLGKLGMGKDPISPHKGMASRGQKNSFEAGFLLAWEWHSPGTVPSGFST